MPLLGMPFLCGSAFDGAFWWKDATPDPDNPTTAVLWIISPLSGDTTGIPATFNSLFNSSPQNPAIATLDGYNVADFDGVDDNLGENAIARRFGSGSEFTFVVLLKLDASPTNLADTSASNMMIYSLINEFGPGPFYVTTKTIPANPPTVPEAVPEVCAVVSDGSLHAAVTGIAVGDWQLVQVRAFGGSVGIRVNGGSWSTVAFTGLSGFSSSYEGCVGGTNPIVGIFPGPAPLDGKVAQILVTPNALSDAVLDEFRQYLNDRYASISV